MFFLRPELSQLFGSAFFPPRERPPKKGGLSLPSFLSPSAGNPESLVLRPSVEEFDDAAAHTC